MEQIIPFRMVEDAGERGEIQRSFWTFMVDGRLIRLSVQTWDEGCNPRPGWATPLHPGEVVTARLIDPTTGVAYDPLDRPSMVPPRPRLSRLEDARN
jgi:hypothetical protein